MWLTKEDGTTLRIQKAKAILCGWIKLQIVIFNLKNAG
jgi:hypothetical protein